MQYTNESDAPVYAIVRDARPSRHEASTVKHFSSYGDLRVRMVYWFGLPRPEKHYTDPITPLLVEATFYGACEVHYNYPSVLGNLSIAVEPFGTDASEDIVELEIFVMTEEERRLRDYMLKMEKDYVIVNNNRLYTNGQPDGVQFINGAISEIEWQQYQFDAAQRMWEAA